MFGDNRSVEKLHSAISVNVFPSVLMAKSNCLITMNNEHGNCRRIFSTDVMNFNCATPENMEVKPLP